MRRHLRRNVVRTASSSKSFVFMNLSQDKELSLYHWSAQRGVTTRSCKNQYLRSPSKVYKRSLPPPILGKRMARLHHERYLNEGNKSMNLMFHQWNPIQWEKAASSYQGTCNVSQGIQQDIFNDLQYQDCNNSSFSSLSSTGSMASSFISSESLSQSSPVHFEFDFHEMDRTSSFASECGPDFFSTVMDQMLVMENKTTFQDFAMPCTFPFACIMAHAVQGQTGIIQEILNSLNRFWTSYEVEAKTVLSSQQDTEGDDRATKSLEKLFRHGMGWCGWYLSLSYYRMRAFTHALPLTNSAGNVISDDDIESVLDSIGMVGLKLMRWGFRDSIPDNKQTQSESIVEQLVPYVREILQEEIDVLLSVHSVNLMFGEGEDSDVSSSTWSSRNRHQSSFVLGSSHQKFNQVNGKESDEGATAALGTHELTSNFLRLFRDEGHQSECPSLCESSAAFSSSAFSSPSSPSCPSFPQRKPLCGRRRRRRRRQQANAVHSLITEAIFRLTNFSRSEH